MGNELKCNELLPWQEQISDMFINFKQNKKYRDKIPIIYLPPGSTETRWIQSYFMSKYEAIILDLHLSDSVSHCYGLNTKIGTAIKNDTQIIILTCSNNGKNDNNGFNAEIINFITDATNGLMYNADHLFSTDKCINNDGIFVLVLIQSEGCIQHMSLYDTIVEIDRLRVYSVNNIDDRLYDITSRYVKQQDCMPYNMRFDYFFDNSLPVE